MRISDLEARAKGNPAAKEIAARLGIEHRVVALAEQYKKTVLDYFREEYLAGTLPDDPASLLVLSQGGMTGPSLTLSWPGVAGKIYRIRGSSDLSTWTPAGPLVLVTADGEQWQTIDAGGVDHLYFRAETVP